MKSVKNTLSFKIITSYFILSAIAIFVCVFLYQQLKQDTTNNISEEKEAINTSAMISALYEADSYAALSLQSLKQDDFNVYTRKNDSLITSIKSLKVLNSLSVDESQLDTIAALLIQKKRNIEQLRLIKIAINKDNALDAILSEFETLETNMGRITIENFIENPKDLTEKERQTVLDFTNYVNGKKTTVSSKVIDTMLNATRKIVRSAKKSSIRLRRVLIDKENMLVTNDLEISIQLRTIISNLSAAIDKRQYEASQLKNKKINESNNVVKIAGGIAAFFIILFSYFIISDFFKAQRLKNALLEEQHNTKNILKSRERLIASVSHELKTPLTTISGYSQLLKKTSLTKNQIAYNNAINENALYINHLAQDLLDFSKLEANKIAIVNTSFNLYKLLEKIMNGALIVNSNNNISGMLDIEDELKELYFFSDALRIEQVITNLVSNAFKFTKAGTIRLKARIQEDKNNQTIATITVSDTGIGIAPEKQKTIFDPFTQADKSIIENYGGSGLGLTISKKLTSLLNGTLSVKSVPNSGSTFVFSIPLKEVEKPQKRNPYSAAFNNCIIIDDDLSLLALLEALFVQLNIKAHCFSSFTLLQEETPATYDFILTDLQMPEDSGFSILQKVKNGNLENYTGQPVFLMSGNLDSNKNYYLEEGFSGVIDKPFTLEQLASLLNISAKNSLEKQKVVVNENYNYSSFNSNALKAFLPDSDTMKEVLSLFIKETKRNRKVLATAIEKSDYSLLQKTTHKMCTMSIQLEANAVTKNLIELEKSSQLLNGSEQLQTKFNTLDKDITLLLDELTHYLNQ